MTDPSLIPESLRGYFAALEEILHDSSDADAYHHCFGCGPGHPTGLRVRCFKTDAGVASPVWIAKSYEGPPGAAHGGIVAASSTRSSPAPSCAVPGASESPES